MGLGVAFIKSSHISSLRTLKRDPEQLQEASGKHWVSTAGKSTSFCLVYDMLNISVYSYCVVWEKTLFIHLFNSFNKCFLKHLLWSRHCLKYWGYSVFRVTFLWVNFYLALHLHDTCPQKSRAIHMYSVRKKRSSLELPGEWSCSQLREVSLNHYNYSKMLLEGL